MKVTTDASENIVITQLELGKMFNNINNIYYSLFDKLESEDKTKLQLALDNIRAIRNKGFEDETN
jgi:hypothetical protein